jgi:PAS domain S-box-containing protein
MHKRAPQARNLLPLGFLLAGAAGVAIALARGESPTIALAVATAATTACAVVLAINLHDAADAAETVVHRARGSELVVEHAYDAFIAMDRQGKIRSWNAQAESTFGWPRSEAVGRDLADLIVPPQHREAHRAGLGRYLSTGDGPALNKRIEITAMHRVGREFPVELAIWPVNDEDGVGSFNAFVHDISDRKRIDQDRTELADSLRAILETSREGIFEVDRSGRWTFMNGAAGALLGVDPARVMGLDACSVIHRSADQPAHDQRSCVIQYVLHTGKPAKYDHDRFWSGDGSSFTAECRTHPTVIRGEVEGAVVVFTSQQAVPALNSAANGYPGHSSLSSLGADGAPGSLEGWQ